VTPLTRTQVAEFLAFADATLAAPPAKPWIERWPGRGRLVLRFALPLEMAPTANVGVRHRAVWALAKDRSSCLATMAGQMASQWTRGMAPMGWCANGRGMIPTWPAPLTGRPMVRAIRFSSVAPDGTAGFSKLPVDCLRVPRPVRKRRAGELVFGAPKMVPGLGVLLDDRPALLELRESWEPAPRGEGFAMIEVFTGTEECSV
jgi:hypothetical protein